MSCEGEWRNYKLRRRHASRSDIAPETSKLSKASGRLYGSRSIAWRPARGLSASPQLQGGTVRLRIEVSLNIQSNQVDLNNIAVAVTNAIDRFRFQRAVKLNPRDRRLGASKDYILHPLHIDSRGVDFVQHVGQDAGMVLMPN